MFDPANPYARPRANRGPMKPVPQTPRLPLDYGHSMGGHAPQPAAPAPIRAHIPERPVPNPGLGGGVAPMTPRPPHMPGPLQQRPVPGHGPSHKPIFDPRSPHIGGPRLREAQKQALIQKLMEQKRREVYGSSPAHHQKPQPRPRY